jgi:hypothetical protein
MPWLKKLLNLLKGKKKAFPKLGGDIVPLRGIVQLIV